MPQILILLSECRFTLGCFRKSTGRSSYSSSTFIEIGSFKSLDQTLGFRNEQIKRRRNAREVKLLLPNESWVPKFYTDALWSCEYFGIACAISLSRSYVDVFGNVTIVLSLMIKGMMNLLTKNLLEGFLHPFVLSICIF